MDYPTELRRISEFCCKVFETAPDPETKHEAARSALLLAEMAEQWERSGARSFETHQR
jgi:hypothetical protein